jgi:glucosamine--fructose-6-phosphate aminotransferase (isomerizing)
MADTGVVIEGGYLRDILAQPRALADTLAGLELSPPMEEMARRLRAGGFSRIVITGMGGSYWALFPLYLDLLRQKFPVVLMETSELLHYLPALPDERTLLIAASQSGRSAEIVRLLEIRQPGCFTLAVTNTPGAPLAAEADAVVPTRAGEEFTVSCKTYMATLLALAWLADVLGERSPDYLAQAAPAAAAYLENWRQHVADAALALAGARHLFYLGRGSSLAAAGTAGLITKESTHRHAEGMSAAAFRHGPMEMVDASVFALVFEGDPATAGLNRHLAADIRRAGGHAVLASADTEPGAFRLPRAPAAVMPILEILPVEMITLALAAADGREAGRFERAAKVTETE